MQFTYAVNVEMPDTMSSEHDYTTEEAHILRTLQDLFELRLRFARAWDVKPVRPKLEFTGMQVIPLPEPPLTNFTETHAEYMARTAHSGTMMQAREQIHIDARTQFSEAPRQQPASGAKYAKCGNCGERLQLTGDATEDHHTAMRHKQSCRTNTVFEERRWNKDEYERLISEHAAQPMQTEFRERAALALAAAEASERLQLAGADPRPAPRRRRWWQFWK